MHCINPNLKSECQEEGKQLVGAGQMKDRNSSNLSVKRADNQGAVEAAEPLGDSSLALLTDITEAAF